MAPVAQRAVRLLAPTKVYRVTFIGNELCWDEVGSVFYVERLVASIAKGLLFTRTTGAVKVRLSCFNSDRKGRSLGNFSLCLVGCEMQRDGRWEKISPKREQRSTAHIFLTWELRRIVYTPSPRLVAARK